MKPYPLFFLLPFAVAACTFQGGVVTTVGTIATIVAHSQQACADLAALGADSAAIATQVAAANPNNTTIQGAANAVTSGVGVTNADCQLLASSFTATAPKSLLNRKVHLDPKVFAHL